MDQRDESFGGKCLLGGRQVPEPLHSTEGRGRRGEEGQHWRRGASLQLIEGLITYANSLEHLPIVIGRRSLFRILIRFGLRMA